MSNYNLSLTLESIKLITRMFLDIFIMWLLLYYAIKIIRNNSRTSQIFKGIVLVVIIDVTAKFFGLNTVAWIADTFVNWGFLAIIIVFQPEIRSLLEKIGKTSVFSRITTLSGNEKETLVDQIVTAVMLLSKDQTGALISIEQSHSLNDYIKTGIPINSVVTAELLTSIFVTSTPLHDGAVILQGDRIACASAYFPPTNIELTSKYGARHRAAIGISEISDCLTIVVSEETGNISLTQNGKIFNVNKVQLYDQLIKTICGEEIVLKSNANLQEVKIVDDSEVDAYEVEEEKSVLSKLAIKKRDNIKKPVVEENVISITHSQEATLEKEKVEILQEEISMKLPLKKVRPTPSYPINNNIRLTGDEVSLDTNIVKNNIKVEEDRNTKEGYQTSDIEINKIMGFDKDLDEKLSLLDSKKKNIKVKFDKEGGSGDGR